MKILDPGHEYRLLCLDGDLNQTLMFVKRCDPPEKYPGNVGSHPGATIQTVVRALLERCRYVYQQQPSPEVEEAIEHFRRVLWLLEARHARMHGESAPTEEEAEFGEMCGTCGHVACRRH